MASPPAVSPRPIFRSDSGETPTTRTRKKKKESEREPHNDERGADSSGKAEKKDAFLGLFIEADREKRREGEKRRDSMNWGALLTQKKRDLEISFALTRWIFGGRGAGDRSDDEEDDLLRQPKQPKSHFMISLPPLPLLPLSVSSLSASPCIRSKERKGMNVCLERRN
jgi:hypothetical protein